MDAQKQENRNILLELDDVTLRAVRERMRTYVDTYIVPTRRCIEQIEEIYLGQPSDWYVTESRDDGFIKIENIAPIIVEDKKDG